MNKIKQHSTSKRDRKHGFLYLIKDMYKGKKQSLLHQLWDTEGTNLHVMIKHGYQKFYSKSWSLSKSKIICIYMGKNLLSQLKDMIIFKKMMSLFT